MSRPCVETVVCVGQVKAPHGLKGGVRVESYTEDPTSLLTFDSFVDAQAHPSLTVDSFLFQDSARIFVMTFKGYAERTAAQALKGKELYLLRSQLPSLEADAFYHQDLLGLKVISEDGAAYGTIRAVDNFGAGDLLEISPSDPRTAPFWFPFRKAYVPLVNLEEGYIQIHLDAWRAGGFLKEGP